MGAPGPPGELVLVPVATSVPSIAVLYRAEHVAMVRRLTLMACPVDLAEAIAHRAFARVGRDWEAIVDPLTAARRAVLDDLLPRFHPAGRAPTVSPVRSGAPAAWDEARSFLDPLSPEDRAAFVLQVYDGLDVAAVGELLPTWRPTATPSEHRPAVADQALGELFADAVADVAPLSHLTDLLGAGVDGGSENGGVDRLPSPTHRGRWVGAVAAALVVAGVFGPGFDAEIGPSSGPGQQVRAGRTTNGVVVRASTGVAELSTCPAADPVEGPGGTPLPEEGDTDPRRVTRVLATDRRALIALHRGARDARVIDRDGRVRRTGPGAGRVRHIDPGGDDQIQIVLASTDDCPNRPEAWKGVPLVFTELAAAEGQPEVVVRGLFGDGTQWAVRDRPGHGLCATLGSVDAVCGAETSGREQLAAVRLVADGAGRQLVFGYLPPAATAARLELAGGRLGPPRLLPDGGTFFALDSLADDQPGRIRFFDTSGAAVAAALYPTP